MATKATLKINKPLAPIYLFFGTQSYLLNTLKDQVVEHALTPDEKDFNLSIYDMEETPVELAVEDAETLPFMGEKRVVLLYRPYFLTGEKGKQKVEHELSLLQNYINNPSPDTILIIMAPYEQLDKRKKVVKALLSHAKVIELSKITDEEVYSLLQVVVSELEVTLPREAYQRMLEIVGTDLSLLVNEAKKMALYCGKGGTLTSDVVNEMASKSLESNVFSLIDFIMKKKLTEAYRLLSDLLKVKEEPIRLLALISRQFRIVFQVSIYKRQGFGQKQMAGLLKLHPFAIKIAAEQANAFSEEALRSALALCAEADYQMKTGQMEKEIALELLIHQLALLHK